jgi:hypothetical protein
MRAFIVFVALAVSLGSLSAVELLENGDFEGDLSLGWTQELGGVNYVFDRGSEYCLDPDHEVYVEKFLQEYAMLKQTVPVVGLNLLFSGEIRFDNKCEPNTYGYFSASAVRLLYQNSSGTTLGETRIYNGTVDCDWVSGPDLHLIEITDDMWHDYRILIEDEMDHLPSIDPADVTQITLGLYCYCTEDC